MNSMLVLGHILACTLHCFWVNNSYVYCNNKAKENQKWSNLWKDKKITQHVPDSGTHIAVSKKNQGCKLLEYYQSLCRVAA